MQPTVDNTVETKSDSKAATWMGTLNNPPKHAQEILRDLYTTEKFRYVCGQLEMGDNRTPHVQFYVNSLSK